MPRPRTLDPSNLPAAPKPTEDPLRQAELLAEFLKRLAYVDRNYHWCRRLEETTLTFNQSVSRVKKRLSRKRPAMRRGDRLHPDVELKIVDLARRQASKRGTEVEQSDIDDAAHQFMETIKPERGAFKDNLLHHHVAGAIALWQSFSGLPILGRRYRGIDEYDPHFASEGGKFLYELVKGWDPQITETRMVNLVTDIRRKYAGRPMHFEDFFRFYGATIDADLRVRSQSNKVPGEVYPNIPIYCP